MIRRAPVQNRHVIVQHKHKNLTMDGLLDGLRVSPIAGRGNGLVATRDFAKGECLFVATAFGFANYEQPGQRDCCANCLRFGDHLEVHCSHCSTCYCSTECREQDLALGHAFCCSALQTIAAAFSVQPETMPEGPKHGPNARSSAEFLLRALAARRAVAATAAVAPVGATFCCAMAQCRDNPRTTSGYDAREEAREQAVALAAKHGGQLLRKRHSDAMSLLRSEPCNSYNLRDDRGESCGWVMYPMASFVNHSCLPNAACVVDGRQLVFEALRPIATGEELLQCYVRNSDADPDGDPKLRAYGMANPFAEWGFACACERCDGSASPEALRRFDALHLCPCGGITTPKLKAMGDAATGGPACRCHTHNHA